MVNCINHRSLLISNRVLHPKYKTRISVLFIPEALFYCNKIRWIFAVINTNKKKDLN